MILDPVGFQKMLDDFLYRYIAPLASILFAEEGGNDLKYRHAFTVQYSMGQDLELKAHRDDATITLNVPTYNTDAELPV
jgi:hypothetical protein